jgi:threonine dehydrogenase-like Zn-dependent dehydrogenase
MMHGGKLEIPYDGFAAGLGDHHVTTTLCPGGKERMRRLLEVVRSGRVDLEPLLTHAFPLAEIAAGYELFGARRDRVLEVAIRP